ncbi:MAG: O-antigen translocase [Melioribacter sp.]|uniref:O-antigen translocase n=1 Tax=Melioribacter sp. TaxID=2052167 RepID=UPI003BC6E919
MILTALTNYYKKIISNELIKVFSFTGIATVVKFFTGFISNKILSVIIGPSGIALIGQLSNVMYIAFLLSTAGIQSGIVKYVSEFEESKKKLVEYIQNAVFLILVCSLFTAILLIAFNHQLSELILQDSKFYFVFILYGTTILLFSLNSTFLSIINGLQEFNELIKLNITQSINSLLFSVVLVLIWGIEGALSAIVTNQSIVLIFSYNKIRKFDWYKTAFRKFKIKKDVLNNYFKYTLMGIVVALVDPTSKLLIRNFLIHNLSLNDAGLWEAMNRFSAMYLLVFTSTLGIYMIPKLSNAKTNLETRKILMQTYKVVLPALSICIIIILLLKHLIIPIVFSDKFAGMDILFLPQLIGDLFFIVNFCLSSILMAKAKTLLYIISIILYFSVYTIFAILLIRTNGIWGATIGFTISNILYFFYYSIIFRRTLIIKGIENA